MNFITKYSILIAFTGVLSTSCLQEADIGMSNQDNIQVQFSISTSPIVQTRAIGSVDNNAAENTAVSNLNLYIWNDLFSYNKYVTSPSTFVMNMLPGHYKIVAIANAGRDLGEIDTSTLSAATLADLGINAYDNSIMTYVDEINIVQGASPIIALQRTFAYVAFNFTIANTFKDFSLESYRLFDVPSTPTIAAPLSGQYTDAALCTSVTEYYALGGGTTANDKTYIFENCRPDVPSITDEKARTRDTAPAGATYMELYCRHTNGRLFTFRFYLGSGSPSSFSVKRNSRTQYNITIYSEVDARITSAEAAYIPIERQIALAGTGAGFYDLGTANYTATDPRELSDRCMPILGVETQLESKSGYLQVLVGDTWVNYTPGTMKTIPAANTSGTTAALRYRAYVPSTFLAAYSRIPQHLKAMYQIAKDQQLELATADTETRFAYKATLRSSSSGTTVTLTAENAASAWTDTSDPEKNICIETAAANKNAKYVVQGSAALIKNFTGLYDDETGVAVGSVTSKTTTSVAGTFPVTKTASYTLRFTTATITSAETNQNQTYMLNKNTITVQDAELRPTLNVTLQCNDGDGIFLRNATFNTTERAWTGTEEAARLVYTQAATAGKVTVPAVFVPLKSGSISYTITVSDSKGAVLAAKTVTNTITKKRRIINVEIGGLKVSPYYYSYADDEGEGWGYSTYRFGISISSFHDLDYVGKGTLFTIPITFDFRYDINTGGSEYNTYPPDYNYGTVDIACKTITDLQTTQTIIFKNNSQIIEIFPTNSWGAGYLDASSYSYSMEWLDKMTGRYNWGYKCSGGIEASATSSEIILPADLQLDLAINKSQWGWLGITK